MNEQKFNTSDLIYLFLDGEADQYQKTALFEEMANSSELQNELFDAIEMHRAFGKDKKSILPSAALTGGVFAAAGISNPFADAAPANATGGTSAGSASGGGAAGAAASGLFGRIGSYILTAAAGAMITTMAFLGYNMVDANNSDNNNISNGSTPVQIQQQEAEKEPVQITYNKVVKEVKSENINHVPVIINYQYPAASQNTAVSNDLPDIIEISNFDEQLLASNSGSSLFNGGRSLNLKFDGIIPMQAGMQHVSEDSYSIFENLALEIRGMSSAHQWPVRDILPAGDELFKNMSIGLLYEINSDFALGFSAGKEEFQMYRVERTGDELKFIREPEILWGAFQLKYRAGWASMFNNSIKPFAAGYLGGSKFGPLTKGIIGLSYTPNDFITFDMGVETTGQVYWIKNQTNAAGKIGLTYNVMIHF